MRRRSITVFVLLAVLATGMTGCRLAHAGARCHTTDWGTDGTNILACRSTRWRPVLTVAAYGQFLQAIATPEGLNGGGNSMCAVVQARLVKCSGQNDQGQLGHGTTTSTPDGSWVVVQGLGNVAQVDQAGDHACALRLDHTVACWGANGQGQLGDGSTTTRLAPVNVVGLPGAASIATAGGRSCAVVAYGSVDCWGSGYGPVPMAIPALVGVTSLAVGLDSACAVTGGPVVCWGANGSGQLGNGTMTASTTPVTVAGLPAATQVAMGDEFACARLADSTERCWGSNSSGQLGAAAMGANSPTPVDVGFTGVHTFPNDDAVDFIYARGGTACAFVNTSSPWPTDRLTCWGANFGAMGSPDQPKYASMVAIRNTGVTVLDVNSRI